ncbi:hypothetical protein Tco_0924161 [Tanacetum coccineum]|uniref:Retrovirus-related Pol polyprotein from transposon TNT 1-94 n=1 Tax=Tanacetum coccineum TaxID=301880 RepID=A0ABQ5D4J3_9ASTR
MLLEPDYGHDDSNFYGCAGLRLAFDPTKSPEYKVVRAGSNSCDIDFDSEIYWNDALHWLKIENRQLTHYKLNIEDHEHPIITTIQIPQSLQQGRNFFESYGNMLPMVIGIQIPYMLHLEGKLFESRGCLVLVRRDYIGSSEFTIYEMPKGCSVWSIKYILLWEEDSFLVMNLSRKVVQYNLISKTPRKIYDMGSNEVADDYLHDLAKTMGENILKSIDEGPFKMGKFRETLAEGALHLGPEWDRVFTDLTPKEKERYKADIRATNILLQGLPKDIYILINHYTYAKDIWDNVKMLLEGSELTKDKRESQLYDEFEQFRLIKGETIHEYYLNSKFVNNMFPEWGRFVTAVKLNRGLKTSNNDQLYAYLKQHETWHIARNCTQLKRPHNSKYFKDKMLLMQAQENRVVLDKEQLLFLAGGQSNTFDDDVDETPVQDLTLNEDNVFQADQCDAFDSDVDKAPATQTMFMANLSSADPIYDEAGSSYDSDILSEVQDHDNYVDSIGEYHDVHEMQNDVQPNYVVDSNRLKYGVIVYYSGMAAAHCVFVSEQNKAVNASLTAKLARYKEQVELYERRAKFELNERKQKIDEQLRIIMSH